MQETRTVQFCPDPDTLKILETVDFKERDKYINAALRAFANVTATAKDNSPGLQTAQTPQSTAEISPSDRVNAELQRIFEGACDAMKASSADDSSQVVITEQSSRQIVRCGITDAIDILKSLRQPITTKEVWEILSCLG